MRNMHSKTAAIAFLMATNVIALPIAAYAQMDISISFDFFSPPPVAVAPPPMPVYVVPPPPEEEVVWVPGHWRWGGYDYFWVPGTWVEAPQEGLLWTPGYWSWNNAAFAWHEGYWGPHVGYYGGVNYGGGYGGHGFNGGEWHDGSYNVNRSVTNVTNITNVTNVTNVSFNGGPGGLKDGPTAEERAAASEHHTPPTQVQVEHAQEASKNPQLAAAANHGKPPIAATAKANDFTHNVVVAKQAGARNPAAEKHDAAVRQNPTLAKGAALPKAREGEPVNKPAANALAPHSAAKPAQPAEVKAPQAEKALPHENTPANASEQHVVRPDANQQKQQHDAAVEKQKSDAAAAAKQNQQHAAEKQNQEWAAAEKKAQSEAHHEEGKPEEHGEHAPEEGGHP